ncbi:hypothetical protein HPP92_000355 [Vanilla planifolia]|uniref:Dolichyl-diphosphooligosaccharide--protein glycosyltransferase subunit 2 n=1 Tax=Vanilla planifolia TaxID=51239 RepID=A0A835SAJ3_VANPL|nr:hypothetical protein HPP92_000355 [Vanilla planifolia]
MARRGILLLLCLLCATIVSCRASSVLRPVSEAHRSTALELFVPFDGSYGSLEDSYEALKTYQILGLDKIFDASLATCKSVIENLDSPSATPKDLYFALRVNSILGCQTEGINFEGIASGLQSSLKGSNSLLTYYYSIGGLLFIKNQGYDVILSDADGLFKSIKALSQSDGRWRHDSDGAESSTYASGKALEALAGVVTLADSNLDQSMIEIVKKDIIKLFDSIKSYSDGAFYFDEKHVHISEYKSPLEVSSSVVRGVCAFAEVAPGRLNIPGHKILGLAKFFLSMGVPGSSKDLFHQIDSLSCLENNRIYIPLIVSLPATVLSLTSRDQLKVDVTTVFGAAAPPLTVRLVQAVYLNSADKPIIENQELLFDQENSVHYLDVVPLKVDVGKYKLIFEASFHYPEDGDKYTVGEQMIVTAFFTGLIKIGKGEIAILNSDGETVETLEKLDLLKDSSLSLSANHLQKLRLSFQLTTPIEHTFKPHQVLLIMKHESKLEHIFVFGSHGREYKLTLDFLGLVEKLYYLSGKYDLVLAVGDATMENSFLRALGVVELDLRSRPRRQHSLPLNPSIPTQDMVQSKKYHTSFALRRRDHRRSSPLHFWFSLFYHS